jgi:hypothetical protein
MANIGPLPSSERPARQRVAIAAIAITATAGMLSLALRLGSWGYATRSDLLHQERLQRLVEKEPPREAAISALRGEGMTVVGTAENEQTLRELAERWGGLRKGEILAKGGRRTETLVAAGRDDVYVLYFDEARILRDSTYVAR